jgi:hypothetical protein
MRRTPQFKATPEKLNHRCPRIASKFAGGSWADREAGGGLQGEIGISRTQRPQMYFALLLKPPNNFVGCNPVAREIQVQRLNLVVFENRRNVFGCHIEIPSPDNLLSNDCLR